VHFFSHGSFHNHRSKITGALYHHAGGKTIFQGDFEKSPCRGPQKAAGIRPNHRRPWAPGSLSIGCFCRLSPLMGCRNMNLSAQKP